MTCRNDSWLNCVCHVCTLQCSCLLPSCCGGTGKPSFLSLLPIAISEVVNKPNHFLLLLLLSVSTVTSTTAYPAVPLASGLCINICLLQCPYCTVGGREGRRARPQQGERYCFLPLWNRRPCSDTDPPQSWAPPILFIPARPCLTMHHSVPLLFSCVTGCLCSLPLWHFISLLSSLCTPVWPSCLFCSFFLPSCLPHEDFASTQVDELSKPQWACKKWERFPRGPRGKAEEGRSQCHLEQVNLTLRSQSTVFLVTWMQSYFAFLCSSIHNAVIAVFQKKGLADNELYTLNEGVRYVQSDEDPPHTHFVNSKAPPALCGCHSML